MGKSFEDRLEVLVSRSRTNTFGYDSFRVEKHILHIVSGEENDNFNEGSVAPFKRIKIALRLTNGLVYDDNGREALLR